PGPSPAPAAARFAEFWVMTLEPTSLWAGADGDDSFGSIAAGIPLRVVAPQAGGRLFIYNPLTENVAWVDAGAVGPIPAPTTDELYLILHPPFEPFWVLTHRPAVVWSSPGDDAVAWTRVPQWRYLQAIQPAERGRILTVDPRTNGYGYVDITAVGGSGAPPDDYLQGPPPDDQTL